MDRLEAFTKHYKDNMFKGEFSKSGPGSDPDQTSTLSDKLTKLIDLLDIKVLVDAPVGDFAWMQKVLPNLKVEKYIGIDIVKELIDQNISKYMGSDYYYNIDKEFKFLCMDIVDGTLPTADLVLCRDCLVHLSYGSIKKFIKNFVNSNSEYLLTTTFTRDNRINYDFVDGTNWFPINLMREPFNFPKPVILINESCTEKDQYGDYTDKCLGLWNRKDLIQICGSW